MGIHFAAANAIQKAGLTSVGYFSQLRLPHLCRMSGASHGTQIKRLGRDFRRGRQIMLSRIFFTSKHKAIVFLIGVISSLTISPYQTVFAQTTIFNIPTTDVIAAKKVYFEFDLVSHLESHDKGGFQTYIPRVIVGLGKGAEVGLNVASADSKTATAVYAQPNIKWQFYADDKRGVAMSAGAIAYIPLKDRDINETFGFFYANVSKKFVCQYGPRLTFGGYKIGGVDVDVDKGGVIVGTEKPFISKANFALDKGGILTGYEQPITSKASFVIDWLSGKNGFGYVTPGFTFSLPKNGLLNIGYSFGNSGRKNNALFVYYGITF
jgi:hypothetical protein